MSDTKTIGVEIPANQNLSGEVDLGTCKLVAIELPTTFNATTLTFQAKAKRLEDTTTSQGEPANETWRDVYNDAGTEVSVTVAANRVVGIATAVIKDALAPIRYLRIRTGTSVAPVNINPGASIRLIVKE